MIKGDVANDSQWEQFNAEFAVLHQGFLDELYQRHGSFSKSEIRLVSLMKMNISSKDIADTLNISAEGIKKARQRLRQKLKLQPEDDIYSYLMELG
ncbi:helix-turn-helix transcriptional regulator [Lacihabitans sp. LS3-19]|uniref:helix-turn-helix transcriptional regulator n=1 Tax=Lacihabitans sp. LS3-19 TaxID=2487335 RepID=UPI0020CF7818|nr:helix-turn-helix transcriptional regulator [Lacihabitans sp. LS3-19]MCP9767163.1 helix-turn-helix transcriptional regulator [Lacihabitans sp. LS3-19]